LTFSGAREGSFSSGPEGHEREQRRAQVIDKRRVCGGQFDPPTIKRIIRYRHCFDSPRFPLHPTLPRLPTYYASRSLAQWLTYDIFDLWTGDERKEVRAKVEPHEAGLSSIDPHFADEIALNQVGLGNVQ
jgi:hypothetical protein